MRSRIGRAALSLLGALLAFKSVRRPSPECSDGPRDFDDAAFPPAMRHLERRLLDRSRDARFSGCADDRLRPEVGVAVSGGGIRSATFALGFFEAFAKHRLLRRIDYLSTVSGGGYLGAFIGRFFCRDYIRGVRDVEWVLGGPEQESHPAADPELADARNSAVAWLRENGKYLAPQGSADLLLALSAMLRNWVAVQGIIGTALLSLFLALRIPEVFVYWSLQAPPSHRLIVEAQRWVAALKVQLPFQSVLWWSWCVLLPIAAAIGAFAVGWAYWLVIDNPRRSHPRAIAGGLLWAATIAFAASHGPHDVWQTAPIAVLIVLAAGAVTSTLAAPLDGVPLAILTGIVAARSDVGPVAQNIAILLTVTGSLALVFVAFAKWWPAQSGAATTSDEAALLAGQLARNRLTVMLRSWVAVTAVVLLIAIVDAAGRHAYAMSAEGHLKAWMSGLVAFGTLFASYARKLFSLAAPNTGGKRPGMPVSVLATGAAVIIVLGLLLGYDIAANAVTWNFGCAAEPAQASPKTKLTVNAALTRGASTVVLTTVVSEPTCGDASSCAPIERTPFALWLIGSILLTFAFGRAYGFLNFSSHQVMYSARLTRSYLGASNPARWTQSAPPVTDTVAEDDIEVHKYWPVPPAHAPVPSTERTPYDRGAPLHIVNVTVNETFGGRSQIQQRDRKGIGMALGPGGMSVGVRQHVVYAEDAARASGGGHIRRISEVFPQGGTDFKVFDFDPPRPREFPVEPLSLGRWIGISGAAVSTGVGYRTSPGLSLLAGLANVRLG